MDLFGLGTHSSFVTTSAPLLPSKPSSTSTVSSKPDPVAVPSATKPPVLPSVPLSATTSSKRTATHGSSGGSSSSGSSGSGSGSSSSASSSASSSGSLDDVDSLLSDFEELEMGGPSTVKPQTKTTDPVDKPKSKDLLEAQQPDQEWDDDNY